MVDRVPGKCKVLSSNPSTVKKVFKRTTKKVNK
jgi:hypothetical protein